MMMHFLAQHRAELIERCRAKVAQRPRRAATEEQLKSGVPLFIRQLQATLKAEAEGRQKDAVEVSGPAGGDADDLSEIGVSATTHGKQLLKLGFTVDQVVHDYGDLCQAITDLAFERQVPFGIDEFRTLNRCLDNAIADAVTEYSFQRDAEVARKHEDKANQRTGFLAHELRNALSTATLALGALEKGTLPVTGATGAVLKRSLQGMKELVEKSLAEVRNQAGGHDMHNTYSLVNFISDAGDAAMLYARASSCPLRVADVDPALGLRGNRDGLLAALANVLQNAFKFTRPYTGIALTAYAQGENILIDVRDHCGGLPEGSEDQLFSPFSQRSADRTGLGLGLSIARQAAEADGGTLTVRDVPGTGCVFTFTLPRYLLAHS